MKKEDLDADPQSMDNRRLSAIARNPNHPQATHAKAELARRRVKKAELSVEGAMKRIATTQSNKADRIASGGKKGLETFKKREMQNETKGAPKGYHFTRSGKLRKGDAGADGDGGPKLRSDPLDKQRSKIPPLPEKFANAAQQAAVMAKLKKSGKYDGKEAYDEPQSQAKGMMSPLQKARIDKEKADRDRDGKLMNVKSKPKTEATMKSFSEISVDRLIKYSKSAKKDIDKNRNTVKTALDQPASPKKAKAGVDAMSKLHKRSKGSDMYVNKMTGRSKVKPTASDAEYHKTLANTKNGDQGIEALKKKHGMSHDKATKTLNRLMGMSEASINELDNKTLTHQTVKPPSHTKKYSGKDSRDTNSIRAPGDESHTVTSSQADAHDKTAAHHIEVADAHTKAGEKSSSPTLQRLHHQASVHHKKAAEAHFNASHSSSGADKDGSIQKKAKDMHMAYHLTMHANKMSQEARNKGTKAKRMNIESTVWPVYTRIMEISNKTLTRYAMSADNDVQKRRSNRPAGKGDESDPKIGKRLDKINLAHKKGAFKEESVNELDKKTLGSYIKKAGPDAVKQTAQAKRHSDAGDMADKDKDMYKHYGKSQRAMDKAKNREKGISKAVDKLTKEATADPATVRMMKDNPHMIGQDGPGGMKGLKKNTQKKVKQTLSKDAMSLARIRKVLNRDKKND